MEIIPAIDIRNGKCVRLIQGDYAKETVYGDDPVETARRWVEAGARRLHLVDLDGAKAGRPVNDAIVGRIVERAGVPCQLGGGIRDEASIRRMLEDVGLDRVIIGTQALKQPAWFHEMAETFPGRLALGLDARDSMVATEGWLSVSQTPAIDLARQFTDVRLAAVIYTNIANDGMLVGIDPATLEDLIQLASLGQPVIASGGVTTLADVRTLAQLSLKHPMITACIIGRALYEGTLKLEEALQEASAGGSKS